MKNLTLSYVKLISYILNRLSNEKEIPTSEIYDKKIIQSNNLLDIINNLLVQNNTVKFEGDKIIRGNAYLMGKERYVLQAKYVVKVSETGNRSWSFTAFISPLLKIEKLLFSPLNYYTSFPSSVVRCGKINVIDPLNLGEVKSKCETFQKENRINFSIYFEPPLQAGQIAK